LGPEHQSPSAVSATHSAVCGPNALPIVVGCSSGTVKSRVFDGVILAVVARRLAGPERTHDVHRFVQHLEADVVFGPAFARDVFVQVLAGADTEGKAVAEHLVNSRDGVGDVDWMDPGCRTGNADADLDLVGRRRDGAERRPDERRFALGRNPGMEVIGNREKVEAGLLGLHGDIDQFHRAELLAREGVSEFRHSRFRIRTGRVTVVPATARARARFGASAVRSERGSERARFGANAVSENRGMRTVSKASRERTQ